MCKLRISIIFMLSMAVTCHAQFNHFEYLTSKDGLSNYSINAFYEDEYARMWVATRNGLNCYDGGSFRVWGARNGIQDTYVRNVAGDKNGNLLIQTRTHVYRMDLHTEQIYPIRETDNVTTIAGSESGLWMVSEDTIFALEISDSTIIHPIKAANGITSIVASDNHRLWVASSEGVQLYEDGKPSVVFATIQHVTKLYEDSRHYLWVCTRDSGLYQCSRTHILRHYSHNKSSNSLTDNDVRCITEDRTGAYWIGLYGGLCRLDPRTGVIQRYEYDPRAEHALGAFSVWALTTDKQGTVWIGTYFGGVDLINPQYSPYTYIGAFGKEGYRLSNTIVTCACADEKGNLWIGTNGGGINYLDRATSRIEFYNINVGNPQYAVKSMWLDSTCGRLWVGTHRGGLQWMDMNSTRPSFHAVSLPEASIRQMQQTGDSICVLTQHNIYMVSRQTGEYRQLVPPDIMPVIKGELSAMTLFEGSVWFARANSLYAYPYNQTPIAELRHYELPANAVTLFADSINGLLIGTDSYGVLRMQDASFVPVSSINDVISSPYIMDIKAGDASYVYTTDQSVYLSDKSMAECRPLYPSEEFPIESIVEHSCSITGDTEACIGGVNGMVIVSLKEASTTLTPVSLRLTQTKIDNVLLPNQALSGSSITLQPDNRVLSFIITATGTITREDYRIRFRMKGYEDEWTETHNNAKLSYANLPSGTYRLEAECMGTNLYYSVRVRVLPHWYASWWAWGIYILLGTCLLIWGILRFAKYIEQRTKRRLSDEYRQELQKATVIVMNHLADSEFNIERFAREMLLSRTRLFEKIQQIAGQTPNEFILGIRMREAANMLRTKPELSILDVSILVGFNSCSYFTKCFHHHFGVSPTAWRKSGK